VFVRGDESWLGRAIANLVDNALTHSERDSATRVSVRREEGWVRIAVKSQGAVPNGIRPRLFRRFVTSRGERGGTGLGLAISAELVRGHGGTLELAFTGSDGTTFVITLPKGNGSRRGEVS
jgi:signal transduction histidine kinase